MKTKLYILLLSFILCGTALQSIDYRDEGTIDLTGNIDLKMVFDGGLRPTQTPGLETDSCQIENVRVKIIFSEKREVTMLVERGDFGVAANGKIAAFDLYGPFEGIDEAVSKAERICQVLSLNPGNLVYLRTRPGSYERPNLSGWGGEIRTPEMRVNFMLRPRYQYKVNGAELSVTYRWQHGAKPIKFATAPLRPPPGYDSVSMTPPPLHPPGPPYPPLSLEQAQAVAKKTYGEIVAKESGQSAVPVPSPALESHRQPFPSNGQGGNPIWRYSIVAFFMVLIFGLWRFVRRKQR